MEALVIVRVPGDKSLTQRALILSSLAEGKSRLSGLLHGGDAASTARALQALGAGMGELPADGSELMVEGAGLAGLHSPAVELDLGNSGTGSRLLLGVLAGSKLTATVTGDASLRQRPMGRVADPLREMGAGLAWGDEADRLPVTVRGSRPLRPLTWRSPVASAQVKSAILLAGLAGGAPVTVTEPRQSRDHTERMLNGVGASVTAEACTEGWSVALASPPDSIEPLDFDVPGDISSAAFLLALAALGGAGASLTVEHVGLNPTRTAFLDVLRRMGSLVEIEADAGARAEPVGSVTVSPAPLRAVEVGGEEVPRLIDELPLVAALAARAEGITRITDAAELRAKESDRISAMVDNLRAVGVDVEERPDGLEVEGTDRPLTGRIQVREDHRIAMAFGVLGAADSSALEIDDRGAADVSFPGFWSMLRRVSSGDRS